MQSQQAAATDEPCGPPFYHGAPPRAYLVRPWKHQVDAVDLALAQRDFALFMEMGTGKTATAINILRFRYLEHKRVLRTLIFCPKVVIQNWKREFALHSKLEPYVIPLEGTGAKRLKAFSRATETGAHIFITNYEAVQMKDLYELFQQWRPEVIVCDESQRCKSPKSKRAKRVALLADPAKHRYLLSGTPVLNSPMDVFQQYRVLDGGETFGKNFKAFQLQYFWDKNAGLPKSKYFPDWRVREGALDRLNQLIYRKAFRVTKDECLDLPPLVRTEVPVELSPKQRQAYESMKKHFIAFLDDAACTAMLAITRALRLQQIVSGFLKLEESGDEVAFDDNPRLKALADLLEDLAPTSKVIVWATFRQNYKDIRAVCEKLKVGYAELHGEVPDAARQPNIDRFQTDPTCRIMLANQGAGGIGVNLTAASHAIFYSRSFSLEHDLQAEARNHRGGSEVHQRITRIDLVASGTIDEQVLTALAAKQNIADHILSWRDRL